MAVPTFRISVLNETFSACDEHELTTATAARNEAIKGALAIGSEEVAKGKKFFGAEVKIQQGDELIGRFVVSVGASPIENGTTKAAKPKPTQTQESSR
jgi:hypothetical protein